MTYSYNPFIPIKTVTYNFIKSIVPGCLITCTATNSSSAYDQTILTINTIINSTTLLYSLQSVNVGIIGTYNIIVSCNVVSSI